MSKWQVDILNWDGGYFKRFWFKRNALRWANEQDDLFIDLNNLWSGKRERLVDNPDDVRPPIRYITAPSREDVGSADTLKGGDA